VNKALALCAEIEFNLGNTGKMCWTLNIGWKTKLPQSL